MKSEALFQFLLQTENIKTRLNLGHELFSQIPLTQCTSFSGDWN